MTDEEDTWPFNTLCVLHSFQQVLLEFMMSKELPTVLTEVQAQKLWMCKKYLGFL